MGTARVSIDPDLIFSETIASAIIKSDKSARKNLVKRRTHRRRVKNAIENGSLIESTESKRNIINVSQVLAEIHVEYELLPGYSFKFDCRCWETAAKIYTENGNWCLKTMLSPVEDDTVWVVFSVHHLVHLNETQLRKLFNYIITFRMFFGKHKFSERAKKDKVKGFYTYDAVKIEQYDFLEIYSFDYQQSSPITKPSTLSMPEPVIVIDESHGDFSIVTYLDAVPDSVHKCKFYKMTTKGRFPSEPLKFEALTTMKEVQQKFTLKKLKKPVRLKRTKRKNQRRDKEIIHETHLPMGTLFAELGTVTYYGRTPQIPKVTSTLICTQCEGILSDKEIRMNLNPISIKLEQLSNFPHVTVIENGFNHLYAKIFFVDRTIITPFYAPAKIICFEFIKCFLCEEFQAEELIAFLTTKFVTVEIIGVRVAKRSEYDASVKLSKSPEVSLQEEILLGIAVFDVSDLLRGIGEVRLTSNMSHPSRSYVAGVNNTNNEKASDSCKNFSIFASDNLSAFDISVKLKVRLAYDLRRVHRKILRRDDILNRIFLILNDSKLANDILEHVSSYNYSLLSTEQSSNEKLKVQDKTKHMLTGFFIVFCDKFYIFLEGLSKGYLLTIFEIVTQMHVQENSVYYNSNCIFLTRLYEDFISLGGLLKIKLSDSLEMELRECGLYIGETGSTQKAKVLRKMGLMKLTSTMKSLCQARLFPDPRDVKLFINNVRNIYNL